MTLDSMIKTGFTTGLTVAAITSGSTSAEILSNEYPIANNSHPTHFEETKISTFTSHQTNIGSDVNMFTNITLSTIENMNTYTTIVKEAFNQMNNLNFIEVDDEIDKKIDSYFAKRKSNKTKKILLKRS